MCWQSPLGDRNAYDRAAPAGCTSCGETTDGVDAGYEKPHGYVFEVSSGAQGPVQPVPLKAMGRFEHETAPIDPATGIVYLTEDNGDPGDGFYRFIPRGRLQMLAVTGEKEYDAGRRHRQPGQGDGPAGPALLGPGGLPSPGPIGASELAGATFTPDGRHLFINVRYPGVTCVITGSWR